MILKHNIVPDEDDFTWPNVAAVCHSLGGSPKSLDYEHDENNKLICGDFELDISFVDYDLISGCARYMAVHDDFEYFLNKSSKGPLTFSCIVTKPTTKRLIVIEVDSHLGGNKSSIEIPIDQGEYFLLFLQEREKYTLQYQVGVHPNDKELTIIAYTSEDGRHVWREDEHSLTSLN